MLYEKKMLILSGAGKGVVLIEKSGLGVKFALRTFGLLPREGMKAGIVTKKSVYVRDLPKTADPSAVFYIDGVEIDEVHFAVFARELYLYGTFGKKMWEANLMDLLTKHSGAIFTPPTVESKPLQPIAPPTKVLPLPDGSGIPQSRVVLYGDETLADTNFYTQFNLSRRMAAVDEFLDAPRMLVGSDAAETTATKNDGVDSSLNASDDNKIEPHASATPKAESDTSEVDGENKISQFGAVGDGENKISQFGAVGDGEMSTLMSDAERMSENDGYGSADATESAPQSTAQENAAPPAVEERYDETDAIGTAEQALTESVKETFGRTDGADGNGTRAAERAGSDKTDSAEYDVGAEISEAAAANDSAHELPWELTAKWIKSRSTRRPVERKDRISTVRKKESVAKLREVMFFERCRADIEKLFLSAPRDEELLKLLPDIEWVKVMFDGHTVSVGRSGNVFLCYAVRGEYEKNSPFGDEAQWLPKLKSAPTGKGYWLIFQDLATGEILKSE